MENEITLEKTKQRHGCLAAWLILMLLVNLFAAIFNLLRAGDIQRTFPRFPLWAIWGLSLMSALNVVFAIAMFRWKKWAFFGFCFAYAVTAGLNLYGGIGVLTSIGSLIVVVILFCLLQLGGVRKGWSQLE